MRRFHTIHGDPSDVSIVDPKLHDIIKLSKGSEDHYHADEAPSQVRRTCICLLALLASVLLVLFVFATSSGGFDKANSRALVIVVEGLRGDVVFAAINTPTRAPNLRTLSMQGVSSVCQDVADQTCTRTQSGALKVDNATFSAAPGFASILSGVDNAKHGVTTTTAASAKKFYESSSRHPSFMMLATRGGVSTGAFGSSPLLEAGTFVNGSCGYWGVMDFECSEKSQNCNGETSCNAVVRRSFVPDGRQDEKVTAATLEAIKEGPRLLFSHYSQLGSVAASTGDYSSDNLAVLAELYRTDAQIGQLMSAIRNRTETWHENWLVILTSDRGGKSAAKASNDASTAIPFLEAVYSTISSRGYFTLNPIQTPSTQFDVSPTVLEWFGIESIYTDAGKVQGFCGDGQLPQNCDGSSPDM